MAKTTGGGDFTHVKATADEVAAYVKRAGRQPSVHRVACNACGKRVWGSGMGIGSHRKACPGPACEFCTHGQYHHDGRTGKCVECACKRMTYAEAAKANAEAKAADALTDEQGARYEEAVRCGASHDDALDAAGPPEEPATATTRRRSGRGRKANGTPPPAGAAMLDLGTYTLPTRTLVRVARTTDDDAFVGPLMDTWLRDGVAYAAAVHDGERLRHVYVDRVTPAE